MSEAKHSPLPWVAEPVAWRVDGIRDGKQQVWFYWKPEWPGMHEEQGDTVTPLYAHPAPAAPTLTADFTKALPGGTLDNSTYEQIETALDGADAPMTDKGRFMTLFERIAALGAERDAALSPAAPTREEIIEQCAKFVEQHQETIKETANGSERYLSPRKVGNLMGTAYVDGLRALKTAPAK